MNLIKKKKFEKKEERHVRIIIKLSQPQLLHTCLKGAIDRWFKLWSDHTIYYEIGFCCLSAKMQH